MVFISFPSNNTSEEESLLKKYAKLASKRSSIQKAAQPEPEVVATTSNKPVEAKDAKIVIERLKNAGQLPVIKTAVKSQFKRKQPIGTLQQQGPGQHHGGGGGTGSSSSIGPVGGGSSSLQQWQKQHYQQKRIQQQQLQNQQSSGESEEAREVISYDDIF